MVDAVIDNRSIPRIVFSEMKKVTEPVNGNVGIEEYSDGKRKIVNVVM